MIGPRTREALAILARAGADGTGATAFGAELWDASKRIGRVMSSNGGGDYAAQCMLGRMRVAGLVEQAPSEGSSRWRLTREGRAAHVLFPPHDASR